MLTRIFKSYLLPFLFPALLLQACTSKPGSNRPQAKAPEALKRTSSFFPFFLSDKTMIVNQEQDNEIEGHYLKVLEQINDSAFRINLPDNFYLASKNLNDWMLGWPTGNAWYDAGCENLCELVSIDTAKRIVTIGKPLRGGGLPAKDKRVVFWSKNPSGYTTQAAGRIVKNSWFKNFGGESMESATIIFDSVRSEWIMYIQEVDTTHVQVYAATSTDLVKWKPYNNGKALFKDSDFSHTSWAGTWLDGKTPQTARMYSAIFYNNEWYLFLSGYAKDGKRHIGLVTTPDPLQGPFNIREQPVISPGADYDINGCFYPKVCRAGNKFLLYYDGSGKGDKETVCLAESKDLLHWGKYTNNPVLDMHYGWRSGPFTSEPNYVEWRNDSVWLMAGGYKKYNTEFTTEDSLQGRMPKDLSIFSSAEAEKGRHISGNVMDAQLGVFLSTDGGHTFISHSNNPIWLCNYADTLQNDHSGGDFYTAENKGKQYIIYQAKAESPKRYNILLRAK